MDLKRERDKALKHARRFAGHRMFHVTQVWINRASQFYPVSKRQMQNVQRVFDRATVGPREFAGVTV